MQSVAGHLLAAGSVFGFLAEHRLELFPPEMFEDLFPSRRGRPSVPAEVVASVIVLQTLHGHSDREAVEALTFDLRWKAACGYPVDASGFHPTVLTLWRRRLAASGSPQRIFEAVREVIEATGALAGKTRRAVDSTILDDAVARQDTVTQLVAAIRRVARDVPDGAQVVTARCTGHDYSRPGKPDIAWDDTDAREALVSALVNDALAVLDGLDVDAITALGGAAGEAVALLGLVAGQDVEPAEGSDGTDGRWRIARKVAPDRVISTVDPDARHARKTRSRRQDGFKAHIVVEPDTGLTTACEVTKATGDGTSDAAVGIRLLDADTTIAHPDTDTVVSADGPGTEAVGDDADAALPQQVQVLGDSAYASGDMLAHAQAKGWQSVLKPLPLHPAVAGGFTIDDFTCDEQAGTLTCPAGVTRTLSKGRTATFGAVCADCPLRAQCTTAAKGRTVKVHPHDQLHRAHRQRAADPGFQADYRQHRPMVERSIAWLTRKNRRVPYRGVTKNNAWIHHRVAALNLRRLLTLGLTRQDDTWTLAATA